jgi:hypothetical protein
MYTFGVNEKDDLGMQIWTGYDWEPGYSTAWSLGNLAETYSGDEVLTGEGNSNDGEKEL